jgi:plasmid stability protein
MATITVRNLDPEVQRLLKQRAASHDRSMEAEIREILTESVRRNTFGRDWVAMTEPLRGDFELPPRSFPREISFE